MLPFLTSKSNVPTIHLAQSLKGSHERYPCTFFNLWLFILQRITSFGELQHFGRQLWNISWQIQLHAMDTLSKPIPLHIQHHCTTQTSAALAAYLKKKQKKHYYNLSLNHTFGEYIAALLYRLANMQSSLRDYRKDLMQYKAFFLLFSD